MNSIKNFGLLLLCKTTFQHVTFLSNFCVGNFDTFVNKIFLNTTVSS